MTTRQGGLTSRGGESDHHDRAFKLDQGLAAKLTRRWGGGGCRRGHRGEADTEEERGSDAGDAPPRPEDSPGGLMAGWGEGCAAGPGKGDGICLASVLSICPFVASGEGAGRGAEMGGLRGLAAAAVSGGEDTRGLGEGAATSRANTFAFVPQKGLLGPPILE